jgi:hypothetical protein
MLRQQLKSIQEKAHQTPRTLPLPCDTRWNSYFVVLSVFISLKTSITAVLAIAAGSNKRKTRECAQQRIAALNESWWKTAEQLSTVLIPFTIAIMMTQADVATLHTANVAFEKIRSTLCTTVMTIILLSDTQRRPL